MGEGNRVLFSVFIATGVIFFWRGLWVLLDTYFLPTYPFMSCLVSMFLGLIILIATKTLSRQFG